MEYQWRVETIMEDGSVVDSEIFTSFYDAWAYSQVELVGEGWRMYPRKRAHKHFFEQAPLADQPEVIRPNCEPFKSAWRTDNSRAVWITLL